MICPFPLTGKSNKIAWCYDDFETSPIGDKFFVISNLRELLKETVELDLTNQP